MRHLTVRAAGALMACLALTSACTSGGGDSGDDTKKVSTSPGIAESFKDSRFTGTDTFCTPEKAGTTHSPEDVEPGITKDKVVLANLRLKLEDLEKVGFAADVGDTQDQADTFIKVINDECGGINGRKLELTTVEQSVPGFGAGDPAVEAQQACTKIAKDLHAVGAFSFTGVGNPMARCLTGPNEVTYVTTYDLGKQDFDSAKGTLFSVNHSPENILKYAATQLADQLEGKRIGVVYGDTEPNPQVVQEGLVSTLEKAGLKVVRVDALGCDNGACKDGLIESVQGMRTDKVDAIFPLLDTLSLPGYLSEMVTQKFKPGDVDFFNSSFQAQDSEVVTGKIVALAGEAAGQLYDGATIVSGSRGGEQRLKDYEPDPFMVMCNKVYDEHSDVIDKPYDLFDDDDNLRASNVASHCSGVRLFARAIEAAGQNPTRKDIAKVIANFGPYDDGASIPASFRTNKATGPDAIVVEKFHFPCPVKVTNAVGNCIMPESEFLPLPKLG